MGDWKEDPNFVGIVPLEANLNQKAIERLGPPPGNAEILIRGGAEWVFGIEPPGTIEHPGIVHLRDEPPALGEVSLALAREMAWRWFQKRPPFLHTPSSQGKTIDRIAEKSGRYVDAEQGFLVQALGLMPKQVALSFERVTTVPATDSACACLDGGTCCAKACLNCQES